MGQADPILTRLGAGPAVKKLVETALALSSSQDPQQRNHAYSFMESAIKELEDGGEGNQAVPGLGPDANDGLDDTKITEEEGKHDAGAKVHEEEEDDDKEHKIHEEELSNHNQGPRGDGSEQSTDNTEPYSGQGIDTTTGEKPMQDMDNTVNQWSETNGMIVPNLPPDQMQMGQPQMGMGQPQMGQQPQMPQPGIAPDIAKEMAGQMGPPPELNSNQMMRQMQYTIDSMMKNYHAKVTKPMNERLNSIIKLQRETIRDQKNAIKQLSLEVRETKTNNGSMKLDLDVLRQNATAKFRETAAPTGLQGFNESQQTMTGVQPLPNYQRNKVANARAEIETMDRMLNSNKNPMYN